MNSVSSVYYYLSYLKNRGLFVIRHLLKVPNIILLLTVILLVWTHCYYFFSVVDNKYLQKSSYDFGKDVTSYNYLEKVCSKDVKDLCFQVIDAYFGEEKKVYRCLNTFSQPGTFESSIRLIEPENKDFWTSDSKLWIIDKTHIEANYLKVMILMPFAFMTLQDTGSLNKDVLTIGLGGGASDLFLHNRFPNLQLTTVEIIPEVIELAVKWFGVRNDSSRTIINNDGLAFIQKAFDLKKKYDVIFLDACNDNFPVPCPASNFLEEKVIQLLKDLLNDNGVLVYNVLVENHPDYNTFSYNIFKKLLEHFPYCGVSRSLNEENQVVGCLNINIENPQNSETIYKSKLDQTSVSFDFGISSDDIGFNLYDFSRLKASFGK